MRDDAIPLGGGLAMPMPCPPKTSISTSTSEGVILTERYIAGISHVWRFNLRSEYILTSVPRTLVYITAISILYIISIN